MKKRRASKPVRVRGYKTKKGKRVQPHKRKKPRKKWKFPYKKVFGR